MVCDRAPDHTEDHAGPESVPTAIVRTIITPVDDHAAARRIIVVVYDIVSAVPPGAPARLIGWRALVAPMAAPAPVVTASLLTPAFVIPLNVPANVPPDITTNMATHMTAGVAAGFAYVLAHMAPPFLGVVVAVPPLWLGLNAGRGDGYSPDSDGGAKCKGDYCPEFHRIPPIPGGNPCWRSLNQREVALERPWQYLPRRLNQT